MVIRRGGAPGTAPGVAGHIRVAFEVDDSAAATARAAEAGLEVIAEPRRTPWDSLNARLDGRPTSS